MLKRVNNNERACEKNAKRTKTGEIKVAALSNKRAKHCDPTFSWVMFHKIYKMFKDAKKRANEYIDACVKDNGTATALQENILGKENMHLLTKDAPAPSLVTPDKKNNKENKEKVREVITINEAAENLQEL